MATHQLTIPPDKADKHQRRLTESLGAYQADSVSTDFHENGQLFSDFWEAQRELVHLLVTLRAPLFYLVRGELLAWAAAESDNPYKRRPRLLEAEIRESLYAEIRLPTLSPRASSGESRKKETRKGVFERHDTIRFAREISMWLQTGVFKDATGKEADAELKEWLLSHAACRIHIIAAERTLVAPKIPRQLLPPGMTPASEELRDLIAALRLQVKRVTDLRSLLTENNRLLVTLTVNRSGINLAKCQMTRNDLIGFGHDGLLDSVDKYDPRKGFEFSSFAIICINGFIKRGVHEHSLTIRQPVHVILLRDRIRTWISKNERPEYVPSPEEICAALSITRSQYDKAMAANSTVSLEASMCDIFENSSDSRSLQAVTVSDDVDPRDTYDQTEMHELVHNVFKTHLSPSARLIASFMTDHNYPESGGDYLKELIDRGFCCVKASAGAAPPSKATLLSKPTNPDGRGRKSTR